MEASASSRELSHSASVRTRPLSHFWHSLSQLLRGGGAGQKLCHLGVEDVGLSSITGSITARTVGGLGLHPLAALAALRRLLTGQKPACPGGKLQLDSSQSSMLHTPHPTREVGQQMMTRLAMGSPPSRGCPLLLSSVHSRLRKKGARMQAEVIRQSVAHRRAGAQLPHPPKCSTTMYIDQPCRG